MSRQIVLLRHAEARAAAVGESDRDRPLSARGCADMDSVGRAIAQHVSSDACLVASDATRTAETAGLLANALGRGSQDTVFDADLYDASAGTLLTHLQRLDAGITSVVLVAHNPGIAVLAHSLVTAQVQSFRPGAFMVCRFDGPWTELSPGSATLIDQMEPSLP